MKIWGDQFTQGTLAIARVSKLESANNFGVHTFLNILKATQEIRGSEFSCAFIEKNSLALRAWMIRILMAQDDMDSRWMESFQQIPTRWEHFEVV